MNWTKTLLAVVGCSLVLLAGCGPEVQTQSQSQTQTSATAVDPDEQLAAQVQAALAGASDLPTGLSVEVADGVVMIAGALACEDCGGNRTPGNVGTIQQSLGTVVRAVPGVTEVRFDLDYAND